MLIALLLVSQILSIFGISSYKEGSNKLFSPFRTPVIK